MSYARRANVVVIVEWMLFTFPVIGLVIAIGLNFNDFFGAFSSSYASERTTAVIYTLVVSIGLLIGFLFNLLLMDGVKKGHSSSLRKWYIASIVLTVLHVLSSIRPLMVEIRLAYYYSGSLLPLFLILIAVTFLCYKIWAIKTIIEFRKELTISSSTFDGGVVYSFPATPKP